MAEGKGRWRTSRGAGRQVTVRYADGTTEARKADSFTPDDRTPTGRLKGRPCRNCTHLFFPKEPWHDHCPQCARGLRRRRRKKP